MEVTTKTIQESFAAFIEVRDMTMPFSLAHKIANILKKIEPILINFEKRRLDLIKKYAETGESEELFQENEKGEQFIKIKDTKSFNEEFLPILDEKNDLDIEKIDISEFKTLEIKPSVIISLNWLLKE